MQSLLGGGIVRPKQRQHCVHKAYGLSETVDDELEHSTRGSAKCTDRESLESIQYILAVYARH